MKPFLIILIILLVVLFTVGLPLVLDNCIIGNSFPSNVSNSEWISFFGSYYGAILGGILSLLGIVYTIRFTREQNRTDRELLIRPFFDIRYRETAEPSYSDNWLGYSVIRVDDGENAFSEEKITSSGFLYLKNVGNGPATNIDCDILLNEMSCAFEVEFNTNNAKVTTSTVRPNEEACLSLDVFNSRSAPKAGDLTWEEEFVNGKKFLLSFPDTKKFPFPSNYSFTLNLRYCDLLSNRFVQKLELRASYHQVDEFGKDSRFHCDINLEKVFPPEKE